MITCEDLRQQSRASPRSMADVEKFAFSASERDHEFQDFLVPYIPYRHFMSTLAFEAGMPYLEYVKAAEDRSFSSYTYEEAAFDTPLRLSEYWKQRESWDRNFNTDAKDAKAVEKHQHQKSI